MATDDVEPEWFEALRTAGVTASLSPLEVPADTVLTRAGQVGTNFLILTDGEADVVGADSGEVVARVGAWSILGELALLTGGRRTNDLVVHRQLRGWVGDQACFLEALAVDEFRRHVATSAARRLAAHADQVEVTDRTGAPLALRPLLPTDREAFMAGVAAMSRETLVNRFFTGAGPSSHVIDYLLDVDYVRHFAWVAVDMAGDGERRGVGVGRYIRDRDDPTVAEFAITVADDARRRGVASLILGALAVAATDSGVTQLVANVRAENRAMRSLLDGLDASWTRTEPGVVTTTLPADRLTELLPADVSARVEANIAAMVRAATLALA